MSSFPRLKTDAAMQYPVTRVLEFSTEVVRFIDGSEQRYRDFGGPLRSWKIRLDLLDESEAAAVEEFFTEMQGAFGTFTFTDPWDGSEYAGCTLDQESIETLMTGEMRTQTALLVRENRS